MGGWPGRAGELVKAAYRARDGAVPLGIFKSRPEEFDLVVTDLTMPKLTGLELAKEILEIKSDLPIVLCIGFSEQATLEKVESLGIKELIDKPPGLRKRSEVVRNALDGREEPPV